MKNKILVIDNYDSFTFNLIQLIGRFTIDITVKRNDKLTIREIELLDPDGIVISPGPGRPENSAISLEVIKQFAKTIPILGVCLGHQAIGYVFGAEIENSQRIMHGKISEVIHDNKTLYAGIPQNFQAGRYHSLIINKKSLPDSLEISSFTNEEEIMGVRHKEYPLEGIQFHPESILTNIGEQLISNWMSQVINNI